MEDLMFLLDLWDFMSLNYSIMLWSRLLLDTINTWLNPVIYVDEKSSAIIINWFSVGFLSREITHLFYIIVLLFSFLIVSFSPVLYLLYFQYCTSVSIILLDFYAYQLQAVEGAIKVVSVFSILIFDIFLFSVFYFLLYRLGLVNSTEI